MEVEVKEESLEQLLEEIMGRESPSPAVKSHEKPKRSRWQLAPIWLILTVLAAFFTGIALGYYWGNTEEIYPLSKIMEQSAPPKEEIIEPLSPPEGLQKLAQEAIL